MMIYFNTFLLQIIQVTDQNLEKTLANNPKLMLKMFAPWCGHCKQLAPIYEQLSNSLTDVAFGEIDCTVSKHACSIYGVQGYPTLKFIYESKVYDYENERSAQAIQEWIEIMTQDILQPSTEESIAVKFNNKDIYFIVYGDQEIKKQMENYLGPFKGKQNFGYINNPTFQLKAFRYGRQISFMQQFSQQNIENFINVNKYDFLPPFFNIMDKAKQDRVIALVCSQDQQLLLKNEIINIQTGDQLSPKYQILAETPISTVEDKEKFLELFDPQNITTPYFLVLQSPDGRTFYYYKQKIGNAMEIFNQIKKLQKIELTRADDFETREKKQKQQEELKQQQLKEEQERLEKLKRIQQERENSEVILIKPSKKIVGVVLIVALLLFLVMYISCKNNNSTQEEEEEETTKIKTQTKTPIQENKNKKANKQK